MTDEQMKQEFAKINGRLDDVSNQFGDVNKSLADITTEVKAHGAALQDVTAEVKAHGAALQDHGASLRELKVEVASHGVTLRSVDAEVHRQGIRLEDRHHELGLAIESFHTLQKVTNAKLDGLRGSLEQRIVPLELTVRGHTDDLARHERQLAERKT